MIAIDMAKMRATIMACKIFGAADGTGSSSINVASKGGCVAGDTRRYQLWSRDPITSVCGSNFNLSNGLEITWDV